MTLTRCVCCLLDCFSCSDNHTFAFINTSTMLDVSLASGPFPTPFPSARTCFFALCFSVTFSSLLTLLLVLTFPGPELMSTEDWEGW